jgi:hypothetical protein
MEWFAVHWHLEWLTVALLLSVRRATSHLRCSMVMGCVVGEESRRRRGGVQTECSGERNARVNFDVNARGNDVGSRAAGAGAGLMGVL